VTFKTKTLPFLLCNLVTTLALAQAPAMAPAPAKCLLPEPNVFEIGLVGGMFFPSSQHNIEDESLPHRAYRSVAPELGLRVAYFPWAFLGAELETVAMPAKVDGGGGAGLWAARGHFIGQLATSRITPFALLGYGALGGVSKEMGTDTDPAVHFGIGAKAALDEALSVRIDLRDTMAQKYNDTAGVVHHPELLLGLSMTLGRSKPKDPPPPPPPTDSDKDGFPDAVDACPALAGVAAHGCPPPPDRDHDSVVDSADECPDIAGDMPNGCVDPDPDKDGVAAEKDKCPTEPETSNGFEDDDGCPDEVSDAVKQ